MNKFFYWEGRADARKEYMSELLQQDATNRAGTDFYLEK